MASDRGRDTFREEPPAPVDDTFAAREGHGSPYAHSGTQGDIGADITGVAFES